MAEIKVNWAGKDYTIPASRAFALGERVEEIVSLGEMASWGSAPRFHKLARAFAEILRFAGCKVSDQDVFSTMMAEVKSGGGGDELAAVRAIAALTEILMDGAPVGGDEAPGKKKSSSARRSG